MLCSVSFFFQIYRGVSIAQVFSAFPENNCNRMIHVVVFDRNCVFFTPSASFYSSVVCPVISKRLRFFVVVVVVEISVIQLIDALIMLMQMCCVQSVCVSSKIVSRKNCRRLISFNAYLNCITRCVQFTACVCVSAWVYKLFSLSRSFSISHCILICSL